MYYNNKILGDISMSNNVKRIIYYLIYVIVFGFFVIEYDILYRYFKDIFLLTYKLPYLWIFLAPLLRMLIGVLLALPHFISTYTQEGSWKIDWIPLITVGLPAFCVAIVPILSIKWQPDAYILNHYLTAVKVAAILFGFILLNSFGKQKSELSRDVRTTINE
jgi:hypothetical protein